MKISKSQGVLVGVGVASLLGVTLAFNSLIGNNDSGYRQFVQTYMGSQKVVFEAGPYGQYGGFSVPYADVLTLDNTGQDGKCEYERGDGFKVQYADGGYGVICAQAQFPLPNDETIMKDMHKRYRSEEGVRLKLNEPTLRSIFTTTAKLYTSTEAYSTKSSELQQALKDQILNGSYLTEIETRKVESGVDEEGNIILQDKEFAIVLKEGAATQYGKNPFEEWGMAPTIQLQVTGFDFETNTITQINNRRDANNRALTAQDKAKAAYWEAQQAEAEGEKARVEEEYKQKRLAEEDIQKAEKAKKLALIEAEKLQEQAVLLEQAALARTAQAEQDLKAARFEAETIVTLADAEAYKIREKINAELPKLELRNQVEIAEKYSKAIASMNVPENLTILGGSGVEGNTSLTDTFLQLGVVEKIENKNKTNKLSKETK